MMIKPGDPQRGHFLFPYHDQPLWWLDNVMERILEILRDKPEAEWAIRFHHLTYVPQERVPTSFQVAEEAYRLAKAEYSQARATFYQAQEARSTEADYDQTDADYDLAEADYNQAVKAYQLALAEVQPELEALAQELIPDCQWDGESILSGLVGTRRQ